MVTTKDIKTKEIKKKAPKTGASVAIGRRKRAVAKAKIESGSGKIEVNGSPVEKYFTVLAYRFSIDQPLAATGMQKQFDIKIKVRGGGKRAQAEAARLAIARCLIVHDVELRPTLKAAGFLTRDSREKERKKPGLKGARRAPQFSKR